MGKESAEQIAVEAAAPGNLGELLLEKDCWLRPKLERCQAAHLQLLEVLLLPLAEPQQQPAKLQLRQKED